jgi:predicted ribosomally synthesized peptide with SipW-like signal peptide
MSKLNNKKKLSALSLAMVGAMAVAGVSAYFTDADTATNTFTVGKVSMDLQEPNWDPPTDITPNEEFAKDPQIKNDGINEEYVFMEVVVPYANVVTANADGSRNAKADTELFIYEVNDGWVELEAQMVKDEDAKTVTHLYAYAPALNQGMTSLGKDVTTPTLFDYIRFANVIEDEGLEGETKHVVVNAYGIQTNFLTDATLDGADDGIDTPAEVWSVLSTQGPSTDKGTEAPNTDIVQ